MTVNIGTITAGLHTVDRDEVIYGRGTNTISHTDTVALRRTPPKSTAQPLRTNVRFERGFAVSSEPGAPEKPVTVSIAVTVPPGVDTTAVKAYVAEACTQAAATAGEVGVTGDIHLGS